MITDVFNVTTRSKNATQGKPAADSDLNAHLETEELYFVQDIVDDKTVRGQKLYKVRWKGYAPSQDSWEPEENLTQVPDVIQAYLDRKADSDSPKKKQPRLVRNKFTYEYVPKNQLIASKTKEFDDIISGKVDLSSYDLYSRVKTRKRLLAEQSSCTDRSSIDCDSDFDHISCNSAPSTPKNDPRKKKMTSSCDSFDNLSLSKPETGVSSQLHQQQQQLSLDFLVSQEDMNLDSLSPVTAASPAKQQLQNGSMKHCNDSGASSTKSDVTDAACLTPRFQVAPAVDNNNTPNNARCSRVVYNLVDFFHDYAKALRDCCSISTVPVCRVQSQHQVEINTLDQLCTMMHNGQWTLIDNLPDDRLRLIFSTSSRHPLHVALWEGEGRSQFLDRLARGFQQLDLDAIDSNSGYSFAHLTVTLGRLSSLKWFLEQGAKPNAHEIVSGRDRTLLGEAICQGNLAAVSILLLHGANLYMVERNLTALGLIRKLLETHALNRPHQQETDQRRFSVAPSNCLLNARQQRSMSEDLSPESGTQLYLNARMHQSKVCHGNIPLVHGSEVHCTCLPSVNQLRGIQQLVNQYHMRLSEDIHHVVDQWLCQYGLKRVAVMHHCLWHSVNDLSACFDFTPGPVDEFADAIPLLILIHGKILAPSIFDLWLDAAKGPCFVQQVLVNGVPQRAVGEHLFASTVLVPMSESGDSAGEGDEIRSTHRVVVAFKQAAREAPQRCVAMIMLLVQPFGSPFCRSSSSVSLMN